MNKSTRSRPSPKGSFSFGKRQRYADNAAYAKEGTLFDIIEIAFEPERGFEHSDRWAITVRAKGQESEVITLGSNQKRDEELRDAQRHLEHAGVIRDVRLIHSGNAYYFRSKGA